MSGGADVVIAIIRRRGCMDYAARKIDGTRFCDPETVSL